MIKQGIIIDTSKFIIVRDCTYDDKRIDGTYYKIDGKDLIPIVYVYPVEHRKQVEHLMLTAREAKIRYDKIIADIYYKELPKVRE